MSDDFCDFSFPAIKDPVQGLPDEKAVQEASGNPKRDGTVFGTASVTSEKTGIRGIPPRRNIPTVIDSPRFIDGIIAS